MNRLLYALLAIVAMIGAGFIYGRGNPYLGVFIGVLVFIGAVIVAVVDYWGLRFHLYMRQSNLRMIEAKLNDLADEMIAVAKLGDPVRMFHIEFEIQSAHRQRETMIWDIVQLQRILRENVTETLLADDEDSSPSTGIQPHV